MGNKEAKYEGLLLLRATSRARTYKVKINGTDYIKKEYHSTKTGSNCFNNEVKGNKLFSKYLWKDKWVDYGDNWFISECYPSKNRLDKIAPSLSKELRQIIAGKVLSAVLDLHVEGYAHRDLHAKNVFYNNGDIKLVDFETLMKYKVDQKPTFLSSYDIRGRGLNSPFTTGNMCFTNNGPSSITKVLNISLDKAIGELKRILMEEIKVNYKANNINIRPFTLPNFSVGGSLYRRDYELLFRQLNANKNIFKDKSIIDFDSNIGSIIFEVQKFKPAKSVGIDSLEKNVYIANRLASFSNLKNVTFRLGDVNSLNVNMLGGKYDIVFCFDWHTSMVHSKKLFRLLSETTNEMLILEISLSTDVNKVKKDLVKYGFKKIEILGGLNPRLETFQKRNILKALK